LGWIAGCRTTGWGFSTGLPKGGSGRKPMNTYDFRKFLEYPDEVRLNTELPVGLPEFALQ
jgi:hypothetical protein